MTAPDQTEYLIVCSEIATSLGGEHLDVFRVPGVAGERSFLPHNSRPVAQSSSLSTTARRQSKMCLMLRFRPQAVHRGARQISVKLRLAGICNMHSKVRHRR